MLLFDFRFRNLVNHKSINKKQNFVNYKTLILLSKLKKGRNYFIFRGQTTLIKHCIGLNNNIYVIFTDN